MRIEPPALLEKPGLIDHQHRVLVRKMLGAVDLSLQHHKN
jgi:hypothetical protein